MEGVESQRSTEAKYRHYRLQRQDYCNRHGRGNGKEAGWDVEVAGNIGPAVLDALMRRQDSGKLPQAWILEVSSFQLGNYAEVLNRTRRWY